MLDKQFEKWAVLKLKKLQKVLLLEDFHPLRIEPSGTNASECQFNYPYKSITIRYSRDLIDRWKKGDKEHALDVLTHEMCHPITDPLYAKSTNRWASKDEIEDERERLTDHLTNIIRKNNLI